MPDTRDDFRLLTLKAAADKLGVSVRTLQRRIAEKRIRTVDTFGRPRISAAELRRHIEPSNA
jgi:excisionase family DNA binding protein